MLKKWNMCSLAKLAVLQMILTIEECKTSQEKANLKAKSFALS